MGPAAQKQTSVRLGCVAIRAVPLPAAEPIVQTSHIRDNLAVMTGLIATGVPVLDPQAEDVADVVKAPTKRPDGKGVTQRLQQGLLRYPLRANSAPRIPRW
jgi:hypothetical protein